jgi:hypothetical protein
MQKVILASPKVFLRLGESDLDPVESDLSSNGAEFLLFRKVILLFRKVISGPRRRK